MDDFTWVVLEVVASGRKWEREIPHAVGKVVVLLLVRIVN